LPVERPDVARDFVRCVENVLRKMPLKT